MCFRMFFIQIVLTGFVCLSLCVSDGSASSVERVPQLSLWGTVVDFTTAWSHWKLKPGVSIPALQELTVCLSLKLKAQVAAEWTVFMYRPPNGHYTELGLAGNQDYLVVWLFGRPWRSPAINLLLRRWYSLCITWSHTKDKPSLYIDDQLVDMSTDHPSDTCPSSCRKLAPNGTLTLGVSHALINGNVQIIPFTNIVAKVSLFRLWERERGQQEVTSVNCTEGDVLKWERDYWDTVMGIERHDSSLQCEWSYFEVRLTFALICNDGHYTEVYTARDVAHHWLRDVLPHSIYLHRVSVFEVSRSGAEDGPAQTRFQSLVHVSVIPSMDVAAVQFEMYMDLRPPYHHQPSGLEVVTEEATIHTTPVGSFSTDTTIPPDVVTTTTKTTTATSTLPPNPTLKTTTTPQTTSTTTITPQTTSTTTTTPKTTSTTTQTTSTTTTTPQTTSTTTTPKTTSTTTQTTSTTTTTTTPQTTSTTTQTTSTTTTPQTTSTTTTTTTPQTTSTTTTTTTPQTTSTTTTTPQTSTTTTPKTTSTTTLTTSTTTTTPQTSTTTTPKTTSSTTTTPKTSSSRSTLASAATGAITTTSHLNISELFFEVKVNVSITGNWDTKVILSTWLVSCLPDDMTVLSLQLLPRAQRHYPDRQANLTWESCVFQVQVMKSPSDPQEIEEQIRELLLMPYNNGSVTVATQDVEISRILILKCSAETLQTIKGAFEWPATSGGENATRPCPKNPNCNATRHCKLCLSTHWTTPDLEDCFPVVDTIPDLDHVQVTTDNSLDVVEMIEDLLQNHSTINYQELVTVLKKVEDIVNVSVVTPHLGQALINIISDILESDSNLAPFTNTILNITEAVGDRMEGYNGSFTMVAPAIAISVVDVVPDQFGTLTFGVLSDRAGSTPEIFINRCPFNSTVAFISLPPVLQHSFPQVDQNQSPPRVQFQFYGMPLLFNNGQEGQNLNSFVVSASVTNTSSPIKDLEEDVKVTLHHLTPRTLDDGDVKCVYWNFNKNHGQGGWDDHGCRKHNSSSDYTTCLCDHLTHFGVLLDVSRAPVDPTNEKILTIITYVGCGVSSLFLGITFLTYTVFEKLRRDYPSQILINLCLALLGLNLVFLVNSWLSSWGLYGLCVAAAAALHYFLLASFTWMGLEAVNMYFALVKVFNVYVPSYILKFCALGWGLPLVVCTLVLILNREAYGSHLYTDAQHALDILDQSDNFCWLQDNVTFYVSVVAYALLIFLFNIGVFVVVLIQIRHMRANKPAGIRSGLMHDLKGVASLTLLLGLTWTVGFFTWGPAKIVLLYLFSGLNSLQGLFIFFFHCLTKENVRKQWRIHLCFGRFRLEECSEWSNSASAGVLAKPKSKPPRASVPSVHSVKSSSTESTSASSDSSQRDLSLKRPNLGLFVNSLILPRAQRSPSVAGGPASRREANLTPDWRNHRLDRQEQR